MADYSSLKIKGDNATIRRLRFLLGDDLMDLVDNTYQTMLQ